MAKATTRTRKTAADPFAEFEDWLKDGPATAEGDWPYPFDEEQKLTTAQKRIVEANAKLLLDRKKWKAKTDAFEAAIETLSTDQAKSAKRAEYEIRFDRHVFGNSAQGWNFQKYNFPCSVSFNEAVFGEGNVWFTGAEFGEGNVWFTGAEFGEGDVLFDGATFGEGNVWFDGATFGDGLVSFKPEKLNSTTVSVSNTMVEGNLHVTAHFPLAANFRRLKVTETADFSGSRFTEIPDFRDAKFDRPPEVAGMEVPAPEMAGQRKDDDGNTIEIIPFKIAKDDSDVSKLRKLKAMALAANDHEKDGDFFAKEMLAKRGVETTNWFGLAFNSLYYWLSNFGQSYIRPLIAMLISGTAFMCLYAYLVSGVLNTSERWWFGFELSIRSTIPFLATLVRFAPTPEKHVSWFQSTLNKLAGHDVAIDWISYLSVIQAVLGGIFLFLLLLALRNKFRLK